MGNSNWSIKRFKFLNCTHKNENDFQNRLIVRFFRIEIGDGENKTDIYQIFGLRVEREVLMPKD